MSLEVTSSTDYKELRVKGEKGDYVLLVPIGAQIEEGIDVCAFLTSVFNKAFEEYKQKSEEEQQETKEDECHSKKE